MKKVRQIKNDIIVVDPNIRKFDEITTNAIMDNVIEFIETIDEYFNFELFNYFKEESKNIILQLSPSVATSSTSLIATDSIPNYENTYCFNFIKNIYKDNENVFNLPDKSDDIDYMIMKLILDANDILHDAGEPNARDTVNYLNKLKGIFSILNPRSSQLNCFKSFELNGLNGDSKKREEMLNKFIKELNLDLKLKVEESFSLNDGFSLFLQEIYDNINLYSKLPPNDNFSSFAYNESGRKLNILDYYEEELKTDSENRNLKKCFKTMLT